ncbi:MAG: EfeM/EfeO family lipoprotein [Roseiflexaceae bacterium]|nr:EfeM/EfeO family lipoprotein [Roseiflexaceae bacterium]
MRRLLPLTLFSAVLLNACAAQPAAAPTAAPSVPAASSTTTDLSSLKTYLLANIGELKTSSAQLVAASNQYYDLAKASGFDYDDLWSSEQQAVLNAVEVGRAAWMQASPGYEQIEGLVAGVPSLAEYDVILDAGTSAAEGGDGVVPFDLSLADGRTLQKPGNLFGISERALWGTDPELTAPIQADFNRNGTIEFGEALPEANVLLSSATALDRYVGELQTAAQAWQPNESDAFTALVVMVPTMNEYFDSWKNSRFVAGEASTQRDFVAISRLADIQDILSGLEVVYDGVSPLVASVDSVQSQQIDQDLTSLKTFVADVHAKEQAGQQFTAEDADLLGSEAQNRATAITGQLSQVAAALDVEIQE